jgi:hypothetical protein
MKELKIKKTGKAYSLEYTNIPKAFKAKQIHMALLPRRPTYSPK